MAGAAPGDVTLTTDHAPQSADQGAICFNNADRRTNRMSYLQTAKEAPLNDETFSNGYTIETFMKVSADYTNDKNQWMARSSAVASAPTCRASRRTPASRWRPVPS